MVTCCCHGNHGAGHWLNHAKEHCLIGVKGHPASGNRVMDCDTLVAESRDVSQKPDEVYVSTSLLPVHAFLLSRLLAFILSRLLAFIL
jgi:N6-adenosine-specific RNA methylase IME4